jgi:hypothetical protein
MVAGAASMAAFYGPGTKSTAMVALGAPSGGFPPGAFSTPLPLGGDATVAVHAAWGGSRPPMMMGPTAAGGYGSYA